MENNVRLYLLKIIKFNGDLSPLYSLGYDSHQIVELIKTEVENGNAIRSQGILALTALGNEIVKKLEKNENRKGPSSWIEPEIASKIKKIPIDYIFLPDQQEMNF